MVSRTTGGVLHGRAAVRAFMQPEVFAAGRFEPLEMVSGDDVVLIRAIFHATGAASGSSSASRPTPSTG